MERSYKDKNNFADNNQIIPLNINSNQHPSWNNFTSNEESSNKEIEKVYKEHITKLDGEFKRIHQEINELKEKPEYFKQHKLPLARIKKIMKSDEDVKMISAEAPILFAKACELFIMDLTYRAWFHTKLNKRKTLQKVDIATCISEYEIFDFLIDIVPRDDFNKSYYRDYPRQHMPFQGNIGIGNFPFNISPRISEPKTLMKNPLTQNSTFNNLYVTNSHVVNHSKLGDLQIKNKNWINDKEEKEEEELLNKKSAN